MSCLSHRCSVSLLNKAAPRSCLPLLACVLHTTFQSSVFSVILPCHFLPGDMLGVHYFAVYIHSLWRSLCLTSPRFDPPRHPRLLALRVALDVFFVLMAFLFCCLSVLLRPIRSDGGSRLWWVCLRVNTDYRLWVSDLRSPPVSG